MLTTDSISHCDPKRRFDALNNATEELKKQYDGLCDVYAQESLLQTLMIEKLAAIRVRRMELYRTSRSTDAKNSYITENAPRYHRMYPKMSVSAVKTRLENEWKELPTIKQEEWACRVNDTVEKKKEMDGIEQGSARTLTASATIKRKREKVLGNNEVKKGSKKSKMSDTMISNDAIYQSMGVSRSVEARPEACILSHTTQTIAQENEENVASHPQDGETSGSFQEIEAAVEDKDDDDDDLDDDSLSSGGGSASDDDSDDPMAQLPIGAFG